MTGMPDLYDLLGVGPDASEADIRWAYERAVNRAHRHGAHRQMTELSVAFDTLSDPGRRRTYDRHRLLPIRERSPGAAPLPTPWGIVKQSSPPVARGSAAPRRNGRWRAPTLAVFCLGLVAGLLLALRLTGVLAFPTEPTPPALQRQIFCDTTPAGPGYVFSAPVGQVPVCTNGSAPRVLR